MKILAMIPYWSGYTFPQDTLRQRDTVSLGGKALINYTIQTAAKVDAIDDVVIFASDESIFYNIDDTGLCRFLKRDERLDAQDVSIEDIIESFLEQSDADLVVLMHPKNPFLRPATISQCIDKIISGENDTAFVATTARKLAWFNGQPLNYSANDDTPHLSKIEPVMLESLSVYVFSRSSFEANRNRVGINPYVHEIGHFEGFEIDHPEDFKIAELIINAGLELNEI